MNHRVVRGGSGGGCSGGGGRSRLVFSAFGLLLVLLILCVLRDVDGGVMVNECGQFNEWVRTEFGVESSSSSQLFGGRVGGSGSSGNSGSSSDGGRGGAVGGASRSSSSHNSDNHALLCTPPSSSENNSTSSSNSNRGTNNNCCTSSMVDPFLKSSTALMSTFNNSEQFDRFKSKMSMYETVMMSHESSNAELWNATIEGLKVLKSWGVKYWDPIYLHRNHVFSGECAKRVTMYHVCGGCRGGESQLPPVKPCKSLCHNVVVGCIKSPLAEFIESPWKHAVNSVRTAIRLVITTEADAKQNTQPLQDLVADLGEWREPITWWISDYKRAISCEGLPTSGCWNGESIGKYEFGTVTWKSNFNPEFSNVFRGDTGLIHPNVIVELDKFRNELVGVRKTLEKYWPTTTINNNNPVISKQPPHALALSSSESGYSSPHHQQRSYIHELVSSGDGSDDEDDDDDSFESDDEDLEYSNSGYGRIPESDDEDLHGYGESGSGSSSSTSESDSEVTRGGGGGTRGNHPLGKVTDGVVGLEDLESSNTPSVSPSGCSTLHHYCSRYFATVFSALVVIVTSFFVFR